MVVKPVWIVAFFVVQILFILAGLGIVFWVVNKWDEGDMIDAMFGGGIGGFAFFFTWNLIRQWVRGHLDVLRAGSENPL